MSGSVYGELFKVTTFGESHGKGIGCVIDGCPAGLLIDMDTLRKFIARRRPGQSKVVSGRNESDDFEIVSGVFCGKTTGTPITFFVKNNDADSSSYSDLEDKYRPGHADFTYDVKYGFRDYRGGGRSSGRETLGRVLAGAIAKMILDQMGISVFAYTESIGDYKVLDLDLSFRDKSPLYMPDRAVSEEAVSFIDELKREGDSVGGSIRCNIDNLPAGLGEPVFDKFDCELSKAIMSIGAVKAFEMGDGTLVSKMRGSGNNDAFFLNDNKIEKRTNHSGGVLGGITDGSLVSFSASIKPTPSIRLKQKTVNRDGQEIDLEIKGRHDPVIVPRAVVVVEAMASIVTVDMLFRNMSSKLSEVIDFYR
ncbi:MAG: chorismate synthase [Lachnospiraceae bacterium]|nr:chorismate synthase [Lachnospiraceae bacterium]